MSEGMVRKRPLNETSPLRGQCVSAYRRPGYSLLGGVPAEPNSASPDMSILPNPTKLNIETVDVFRGRYQNHCLRSLCRKVKVKCRPKFGLRVRRHTDVTNPPSVMLRCSATYGLWLHTRGAMTERFRDLRRF